MLETAQLGIKQSSWQKRVLQACPMHELPACTRPRTSLHSLRLNRNHPVILGPTACARARWTQVTAVLGAGEGEVAALGGWLPGRIVIPWDRYQVSTQELSRGSKVHTLHGRAAQGI